MSYPILYNSAETKFSDNGVGVLSDAVSCTVTEARNGAFELELRYPVTGVHFGDIALRSLLLTKPNPTDPAQPFRVYRITRPLDGVVTVYGEHISYDLSGIPVSPFTASNAADAMAKLSANAATACPFTFWTDKDTAATMTVDRPASIRSLLGGTRGSVLDVYGGEYKFDRFTVRLYGQRGADRGVSIRYGKNLTDLKQEENCSSVYTGVYPYWAGTEGELVQLPEKIIGAEGTYNFTRILPLDLSSEWMEPPEVDQLRARAQTYVKANHIGVPKVSLDVSFVQLEQTEEYRDMALLERVELCDTVSVEFPAMGVSAAAKVVETVYNVLLERYDRVSIGDVRASLADTILQQQQAIEQAPTKTAVQRAIEHQSDLITGNKGGYVVLYDADGDKCPDEILILDAADIESAKNVLRINKSGIGFSADGYDGPYSTAWTLDGVFNASFITAGTLDAAKAEVTHLNADNITAGTLDAARIAADSVTADKLSIKDLAAIGATIGGFVIGATAIYNGLASFGGTDNGVYVGTDGISLGGGRFKVTPAGALTSTSGTFESVTISGSTFSGSLNQATGSINGVTGSYGGSINSGGTFTGTHSGGTLSATGGTYYGGHYGNVVSNCNLGGTSLQGSSGDSGTYIIRANSGWTVGGASVVMLTCGAGNYVSIDSIGVRIYGTLYVNGNLATSAFKSRLMETENFGQRCLDANETPLPTFSDYGTARLDEGGVCYIPIDPVFAETVNDALLPTVFLTPYGSGALYVADVTHDVVAVKGEPGMAFAWETRYAQANAYVQRLRVMDFDQPDLSSERDFDGEARVDYEHSAPDLVVSALSYLDLYNAAAVDYGAAGADYYENFERSFTL